jgi:hypothetical protein
MKLLANVFVPENDPGFATWFTGYLRSATSAEIAAQLMSTGATAALRVWGRWQLFRHRFVTLRLVPARPESGRLLEC